MSATMKIKGFGWTLGVLFCVSVAGNALAQSNPLKITNAVYVENTVKAADGKVTKKLVPAVKVVPGGEVIYEIAYTNEGKDTATDVVINNAVPDGLTFEDDSATPATEVSVDKGAHYGKLVALKVPGPDGKLRAAQASDVTNLRWLIASIKPGAKGKVSFRARVK